MKKEPNEPDALRVEAETQLAGSTLKEMSARSAEELLHELQLHQIELEMQNETLRQSQNTLEESRDRYVDSYDFAPVGYVTLSHDALITEINLTGATLLGKERRKLANRRFAPFVAPEDRDRWRRHFMGVLQHDSKQTFELEIRRGDGSHLYAQLDSLRLEKDGEAPVVRIALTDITERKQLEAKLKESEERWEFALEGAGDGVWDWNPKTDEALFSKLWKEMIGYAEHEFSNTGAAWVEHLHPDDKDSVLTAVQECFSGSQPVYVVEFRLRCKDGSWKWILARGKLINRDVNGNPLRMIGTHTDITERKLADVALHESETYLRLLEQREIVQTSLDGFWVVDTKNARILEANDAFCGMVGYSREELLAMCISDLEADESPAETATHIKKTMEIGYDRFETRHRHKQGHLVNLEVSASRSEIDNDIIFVFVRDITERKRTEKDLRESESRFRTLFESATDCMLILDKDGRIIDINRSGYERLGYEKQEMLGRQIAEFDTPEYADVVPKHLAEIAKEGMAIFESAHVRKDGTVMPIEISSKIIDLDGEQRYFSVIRDITERKLLEQQLRLKEFVLDQARDAVYLIDRDLRFIYVNEEACRALGYSRDELLGLVPPDIDPDTTQEDARRIRKQILASGHITFETRHRRRDGSLFPVEIQGSLFEYQGQVMSLALARDISERKRAKQKVAELHYRNELILNTAGDGICGINKKGRINFINPAAAKILGYSVKELYGLSLDEIAHPTKLDGCGCPVADCPILISSSGGTTCHKSEEVYRRKDGSAFPVSCTRAPIIDKGQCIGAVVTFRDITERKRAEQQLRELSTHLKTVREEEKANFAREIHDDLGSTLSALKIEAYRLNRGLSAEQKNMPLFARVESMVGLLDDAVAATRRIVTDLRPTMLDDLGLLAALEWQAEQFHQRTGIECRVVCVEDSGCACKLDKTVSINLFRIFQETLTNVARHSGASRVEVEFQHGGAEVLLSISDNGCGLSEGHTIAPTSYGIRGMRERAEQFGGKIKLDCPPSGGLSVTVKLQMPQ